MAQQADGALREILAAMERVAERMPRMVHALEATSAVVGTEVATTAEVAQRSAEAAGAVEEVAGIAQQTVALAQSVTAHTEEVTATIQSLDVFADDLAGVSEELETQIST